MRFRSLGDLPRRVRHRFGRLCDLRGGTGDALQVALQAFEQAVQCRAHLADLVVTTQFDARRQVEFGLDARDGLLHAGQPPADAALERKTETTEEERAEHDRYDRQPVAVGQSGVGLLPLHGCELLRVVGVLGQVFFQRIDERPALDEELLGIRVLAVA